MKLSPLILNLFIVTVAKLAPCFWNFDILDKEDVNSFPRFRLERSIKLRNFEKNCLVSAEASYARRKLAELGKFPPERKNWQKFYSHLSFRVFIVKISIKHISDYRNIEVSMQM